MTRYREIRFKLESCKVFPEVVDETYLNSLHLRLVVKIVGSTAGNTLT